MSAHVLRANARTLPIADNTVDLVVTSPPYFALRSYQDGGEHYAGQIGDEPTPAEFVASLLEVTRECVRVLKPSGSLWVNLGDKYSGAQAQNIGGVNRAGDSARTWAQTDPKRTGIRAKSLIGIPWRYALACIDDLGLILRAEIIWSKPNGLPESVTDRVRRSHEQWFHFTMEPRYYSAVDEIREAHVKTNPGDGGVKGGKWAAERGDGSNGAASGLASVNPLGKLPGSVWTVATEPLTVPSDLGIDHFAAFPTEFPRRIIAGWSPSGVCTACGEGRRPVAGHTPEWTEFRRQHGMGSFTDTGANETQGRRDTYEHGLSGAKIGAFGPKVQITGYACACPDTAAPTTPGVVLDPFGGTGTVALVAKALGRTGISVDMSADYCRLAQWRTNDPAQIAKAARVEKPPVEAIGQLDLFDMEEPA